jgi:hypothetical protein
MSEIVPFPQRRARKRQTWFNRAELSQILRLYSERVARGDWRDYAIDHAEGVAMFSVFRHAYEQPMLVIAKHAGFGTKPAEYSLVSQKRRLARSTSLAEILAQVPAKLLLVKG